MRMSTTKTLDHASVARAQILRGTIASILVVLGGCAAKSPNRRTPKNASHRISNVQRPPTTSRTRESEDRCPA